MLPLQLPECKQNESVRSTIRKWPTTLSFPSTLRTYSACSFLVNWTYFLSNYAQFIPSTLRLLPSAPRSSEYAHFFSIYVQQKVCSVTFFWKNLHDALELYQKHHNEQAHATKSWLKLSKSQCMPPPMPDWCLKYVWRPLHAQALRPPSSPAPPPFPQIW